MSDSSRLGLAFVRETTWGTIPASAFQSLRYVTESLGKRIETVRSDEVVSDAQVTDLARVFANATGAINIELSHGTYDSFLESALRSTYGALQTVTATNIAANTGTQAFTAPSGLPVFSPGQYIRVAGFVATANNGFFQVVTSTATNLVVTGGLTSLVTEAAGASVTIEGTTLVNGIADHSYVIEKNFADVTQFWPFRGMKLGTFSLSIVSRQKITGVMNFDGIANPLAAVTASTGAYSAATTTPILTASNDVGQLFENGAALGAGVVVRSCNFQINTNNRPQDGVGFLDPIGVGKGRINVTGELTAYFKNEVLFNRYLNGTDSSLMVRCGESTRHYVFSFPAIEYTDGDVVGVGNDGDVLVNLTWEAKKHATQGITMRVDKWT